MGKILEITTLILASKSENFWEYPSIDFQTLSREWGQWVYPQPQNCQPHSHLKLWGVLRATLNPKFSRIPEKSWFLKLFLKLFCFIFQGFSRIPQKTSKVLPSFSPQSVRVFEGKFSIPSKFLHHPQPRKSLKNFETPDLNLENSQSSRMRMKILV